jgi:hypothetical protein
LNLNARQACGEKSWLCVSGPRKPAVVLVVPPPAQFKMQMRTPNQYHAIARVLRDHFQQTPPTTAKRIDPDQRATIERALRGVLTWPEVHSDVDLMTDLAFHLYNIREAK